MENCLPVLRYIICGYTAEHIFTLIISSNVSLCSMTFCYSRKLPSKVPSNQNLSYVKTSQKNPVLYVERCCLGRFNIIPRGKLYYRFYWHSTYCASFLKENTTNFSVFLKKK